MPLRAKILIALVLGGAVAAIALTASGPQRSWWTFALCVAAALVTSGLKVPRPSGSGSMSLNYTFVFLAIAELSPVQALLVAALSTAVQCRLKKRTVMVVVQMLFNVANSVCSTAVAYGCCYLLRAEGVPLAPALTLAACAYFLCNTVPVALAIGWSSQGDAFSIWRAEFVWFLPFYVVGAVLAAAAALALAWFGWSTAALLVPVVYTLYRAYVGQINQTIERRKHLEETESLHLRTIEALAMAVEAKDQNTHDHLFRVRDYVAKVAAIMHLDDMQKKALQTAAFLHDIGKLAVPEHIINKPGKLTVDEFEKMKIHPAVGADILERVRFPYPVVPIVRSHHERWDGQGYPDGLAGEDIPVGARVLSVVDCFDALASDRPYRRAMPLPKAMEIVKSMAGTQFDPKIVAILEQCYEEFEKTYHEPSAFQALNLAPDVHRGVAPGAGFQQESASVPANPAEPAAVHGIDAAHLMAAAQAAQSLVEVSARAGTSLSVEDAVTLISARLHAWVPFDCCALFLLQGDVVVLQYVDGEFRHSFTDGTIPLGEGLAGWVAQSGLPILNGNAHVEPIYVQSGAHRKDLRSALAIPLFDTGDVIYGVLTLYSAATDPFHRGHLHLLQSVEAKFSLVLAGGLGEQAVRGNSSDEDALGQQRSGEVFQKLADEISHSQRTGKHCAVVVCALHSLTVVGERHSMAATHTLLHSFAEHLQTRCRHQDTVANLGAGAFAVVMPDLLEPLTAERLGWIAEVAGHANRQASVSPGVSVSYGAAFFPGDGTTAEELLLVANRHMCRHRQQLSRAEAAMPLKPVLVA